MSRWTVQVKSDYDEFFQKLRLTASLGGTHFPVPFGNPARAAAESFWSRFNHFGGFANEERQDHFQNLMIERYPDLALERLRKIDDIPF